MGTANRLVPSQYTKDRKKCTIYAIKHVDINRVSAHHEKVICIVHDTWKKSMSYAKAQNVQIKPIMGQSFAFSVKMIFGVNGVLIMLKYFHSTLEKHFAKKMTTVPFAKTSWSPQIPANTGIRLIPPKMFFSLVRREKARAICMKKGFIEHKILFTFFNSITPKLSTLSTLSTKKVERTLLEKKLYRQGVMTDCFRKAYISQDPRSRVPAVRKRLAVWFVPHHLKKKCIF